MPSTTDPRTAGRTESNRSRGLHGPTAGQVVLLQAVRGYPAVSIILNTSPAPRMQPQDASRLVSLADDAERRLRAEDVPGADQTVVPALRAMVGERAMRATDKALAVFVSADMQQSVTLPVPVRERVVVDPSFATRDLVRALHRTPRHVVLVLTSREARLFDGAGGELRPAHSSAFPMRADDEQTTAFLRRVDRALGAYRALHPSPLVLVAPPETAAAFGALSSHSSRLAGSISANVPTAPLQELASRVRPVLEGYLSSREQEALDLVDRRLGAQRVVSGMSSAWLAARHERPEMLAVEEGLFFPARLSSDGDWLTPATDVEHPDVIDDAVDELIEKVLDRDGWVAIVRDGALSEHDRVALTLKAAD